MFSPPPHWATPSVSWSTGGVASISPQTYFPPSRSKINETSEMKASALTFSLGEHPIKSHHIHLSVGILLNMKTDFGEMIPAEMLTSSDLPE